MTISSADIHLNSWMQRFNALIGDVWPVAVIASVLFSVRTCVFKVQNAIPSWVYSPTQEHTNLLMENRLAGGNYKEDANW